MEPNERLTFKKVLIAIFSRPSVRRRSIGKAQNYQPDVVRTTVLQPKKVEAVDEIQRIMDEINK